MDPAYLPWGTLILALFTFGIWMYIKQVEIVHRPPGPNMWLIVMLLVFLLAVGFVAPLIIGSGDLDKVLLFTILGWTGVGGSLLLLFIGGARLLTGSKK